MFKRSLIAGCVLASSLGYADQSVLSDKQVNAILEKSTSLHIAPDISHLSKQELNTLNLLKQVGELYHEIFLQDQHHQALGQKHRLEQLAKQGDKSAADRLKLFRMFKSPIATTLKNKRVGFVDVTPELPGKNHYPLDTSKKELDAFIAQHPKSKAHLLAVRTKVRRSTKNNIEHDLNTLKKYPSLARIHHGLEQRISSAEQYGDKGFYAVPNAVAHSDKTMRIHDLLMKAHYEIKSTDADFAQYLKNKALSVLTDDYEAGDATWIKGQFNNINAQIGTYETYFDSLYGVKAEASTSILIKDLKATKALRSALGGLQQLENKLPYKNKKTVENNIPVGVYHMLVDYGQARGTNTASILPNESHITRKYGRTILLRQNIMTNEKIFAARKKGWDAVLSKPFHDDLTVQSNYQRTLFHEIGHYLGPSVDKQGRSLDIALASKNNLFEEMKADLVSLFALQHLQQTGYHDEKSARAVYAGGILRVLKTSKPRRTQAYGTMQLMTFNYFIENGVLQLNSKGKLTIDYQKYPAVVKQLLTKLLDIQYQGNLDGANEFIERYGYWKDDLHQMLADKMKKASGSSYWLVSYEALGEKAGLN